MAVDSGEQVTPRGLSRKRHESTVAEEMKVKGMDFLPVCVPARVLTFAGVNHSGALGRAGRFLLCGFFCVTLTLSSALGVERQNPDPTALLNQLNNALVDPAQVYALRDTRITRDRVTLYFNRGFIAFLTKVQGETLGAIFSGRGEVLLIPPDTVEKQNLAQFTESPILEEQFTAAYLRFTDGTAQELLTAAHRPDPEDPEQPPNFASQWNAALRALNPLSSTRMIADLLEDRRSPFFRARLDVLDRPPFDVVVDERLPEAVSVVATAKTGEGLYNDVWCSFPSKTSKARFTSLLKGPARVLSYKIYTRILADHSLEGRADLQVESLSGSSRVLPFVLSRWLEVSKVETEEGKSLVVFPDASEETSEGPPRRSDWIDVVLPTPRPTGERFHLIFTYHGNVIGDAGNGVLFVGARGSWYPSRPLNEPAVYDLAFDYPQNLTLVATGTRLEEGPSGNGMHSHWRSDGGFRVAGFHLGPYTSVERQVGKTLVEVFATKEAEASLEKRHVERAPPMIDISHQTIKNPAIRILPRLVSPLKPEALLGRVAEDAADAMAYYEKQFGPFPYPHMAIAQVPGSFGQGWPELVYLPTLTFLPRSERSALGFTQTEDELLTQSLEAHEIAHQWWGNLLGLKTYHDVWLSEGVASYVAACYLAQRKDGERKFRQMLEIFKRDLLSKTQTGKTVEAGGPVWLGDRLSNSLNPNCYTNVVYKKSAWVLHMLRGLLSDPATGSDERFFRMLRDFLNAHRGEEVSTEDFIHHAEKYMTRAIDLEHDGRLDWFFNEWVYNTGIPTYQLTSHTRRQGLDAYLVQGTIEQSGVPSQFEMLVPVVAWNAKNKRMKVERVVVGEAGGHFRFTTATKPARVSIDEDNLLAVVHQP